MAFDFCTISAPKLATVFCYSRLHIHFNDCLSTAFNIASYSFLEKLLSVNLLWHGLTWAKKLGCFVFFNISQHNAIKWQHALYYTSYRNKINFCWSRKMSLCCLNFWRVCCLIWKSWLIGLFLEMLCYCLLAYVVSEDSSAIVHIIVSLMYYIFNSVFRIVSLSSSVAMCLHWCLEVWLFL